MIEQRRDHIVPKEQENDAQIFIPDVYRYPAHELPIILESL
jgi:hypothetical protein